MCAKNWLCDAGKIQESPSAVGFLECCGLGWESRNHLQLQASWDAAVWEGHYSRSSCHCRPIASLELMLGEETMTMGFLLSLMSTQAAIGQLDGGPLPSLGTGNSHSARLRLAKYVGRSQGV